MSFSHLDDHDNPNMVDVSDKSVTQREAVARAKIYMPPNIMPFLIENNFWSLGTSITERRIPINLELLANSLSIEYLYLRILIQ